MWPRQEWSLRPQSLELRETPSLIVPMGRDIHSELHRETSIVPNLGYHALMNVMSTFHPTNNTLQTLERLMSSIEAASRHHKCKPIERELAMLAVRALDSQLPYLR